MKQQKIIRKMNKISFVISFFIAFVSFSQSYKGTVRTEKEGLHKMMLTPEIRSASNDNFERLRVIDKENQEVPYVLMYNADKTFSEFKPIEIKLKRVLKDSITSIVLENKMGKKQERITLRIANTKVDKRYNVFGSDNGKDWFGLASNKFLSNINTVNKTFVEKTIKFPLNTYKFLRINFKDKNSLPINVLKAGVYESKFLTQEPIAINDFKQETILINDKKITQLKFKADARQKINTISFSIDTKFFLRNAKIIVNKTRKIKKRIETYKYEISSFQLNSKNSNTFEFSSLNVKEFIIEIKNEDNPALNISKVQLYQKPVYLIANLKEKQNYNFIIDESLKRPSYDLGNFISNEIGVVEEGTITGFSKVAIKEKEIKAIPFWQTSTFMWICIALGGLFVVYFALSLLRDIGKEEAR